MKPQRKPFAEIKIDASLIQADASDRTRIEGAASLPPDAAGRAVAEYLAALDDAAFGAASEVTPKFIAPDLPRKVDVSRPGSNLWDKGGTTAN
jgi:hypothetical protein